MTDKLNYAAFNQDVADLVPVTAQAILDLGCGNGPMGAWIKKRQPCLVHGVTYSAQEAEIAGQVLDKVWVADLNFFDFTSAGRQYDCIICSHVLEHLYEPWNVVRQLEEALLPGGTLVIAVPNLLFWKQRWQLLRGRFRYQTAGGLMDITHYRFFDWQSVQILYKDTTLVLCRKFATGMFPQPVIRRFFPGFSNKLDRWMVRQWPGLFGFQFLLVHIRPLSKA
jgi:SAM-dependent methyltransferase